jgi:hypothetical protein
LAGKLGLGHVRLMWSGLPSQAGVEPPTCRSESKGLLRCTTEVRGGSLTRGNSSNPNERTSGTERHGPSVALLVDGPLVLVYTLKLFHADIGQKRVVRLFQCGMQILDVVEDLQQLVLVIELSNQRGELA